MQPFSFRSVSRERLRQSCSAVRWHCPGICCRLFSQSDRRTVCPWHFFRGKIICGGRDDRVLKIFQNTIFCGSDRGGVRRIYAVDVCVLLMSPRVQNMSFLVLIGVMIGYICSAVTDFLVTFAEDSDIVNLHNWSMGSFSGITWENVKTIVFVVAVTGILTFFLSKPMEAYQLGETYAKIWVSISKCSAYCS